MPSAADYQFEKATEDGVAALLESAGLTVEKQQGTGNLSTPRAELQVSLTGARPDTIRGDSSAGFYHAGFDVALAVNTVTTRGDSSENHAEAVGKVRHALRNRGAFTSSVMPAHQVVDIRLTGSSVSIEADLNLDVTTDTYEIQMIFR